jgi:hypothetical protein
LADRADSPIHHVAGCDHIDTRFGLSQRLLHR